MSKNTYMVVSEVTQYGEVVDVPDVASNVNVQPLGQSGLVRLTYLKPVRELALDEPGEPTETNESTRYVG